MSYIITSIGDQGGEGHELNVEMMEDGTIILDSNNPDTGEKQRIVMLEQQWAALIGLLIDSYGAENCPLHCSDGLCVGETRRAA